MASFWHNPYVETAAYYSVVVLSIIVFLSIFEVVTRYNNWEEIQKGNLAVAMATGGKIFGLAIIFHFSIQHHDSLITMLIWGIFGFILLMTGYFIFEFLTPKFNIDLEISKDNRAVGLISMLISIGLSFVIGATIV
ncbi:DUF350 domain-containing protein [Bacillus sp. HMF5848]|uniref:DUF350 domain-containing protein n=1 Tax=Bacillus sp. HMF5848 TaxID=2495421 RepID=UPI000F78E791|nr:DUF350 domain-containing protein [Bacillus sp. HMF5848]RSK28089.1 DUF350 domain-containing protein [Bacillus sp. HMF5848]